MKSLTILLAAVAMSAVSCERHELEGPDGTKQLHEHHGAGHAGHEEHGGHAEGDAHGEHKEHDAHEEKEAAH